MAIQLRHSVFIEETEFALETLETEGFDRQPACVKGIRVLLHEEDYRVEEDEDCLGPFPLTEEGEGYCSPEEGHLPKLWCQTDPTGSRYMLQDPTGPVPRYPATINSFLQHNTNKC